MCRLAQKRFEVQLIAHMTATLVFHPLHCSFEVVNALRTGWDAGRAPRASASTFAFAKPRSSLCVHIAIYGLCFWFWNTRTRVW